MVLQRTGMWLLAGALLFNPACSSDSEEKDVVSSRAYKGHENDLDMNYFVNAYKNTLGTRLDDCQTCHTGGTFTYPKGDTTATTTKNSCDFCHLILHPDDTFIEDQPTTYGDTLNAFGQAYEAAGRNADAFKAIAEDDSDGDGAANAAEIADLKYPGDDGSKPGQQTAPLRIFGIEDLKAMPAHEEFLLSNSHKQEFDNYATYKGVKIKDLLEAAGVDLTDATLQGITVIAPDGYLKDFAMETILSAYPSGLYYAGLDIATLGSDCGFVQYPDTLPDGLTDGQAIPGEQWLMLGYERDGIDMEVSNLDITSGKINGEGPYRIIVPQSPAGAPDRGSNFSPTTCDDGHDFDDAANHNAGDMVRGVIAIRVNPLPSGVEDFDYKNGGWAYVDGWQVIVFGHGVTAN